MRGSAARDFTLRQALGTWQWYALWLTLFLNTTAGIAIISQASPMAQEISHVNAAAAAGLVGIISIANESGRFLWAWFSDTIGRKSVFLTMFLLQAVAFLLLSHVSGFVSLAVLAFVILLCYGGGFGTMPSLAADYFGAKDMGSIYGLMLTGSSGGCRPHVRRACSPDDRRISGCPQNHGADDAVERDRSSASASAGSAAQAV